MICLSFPLFCPSVVIFERRCAQDVQSGRFQCRCQPDLGHPPNPEMLDPGYSIKVRHGPLCTGAEAVDLVECFRLLFCASSGKPQSLGVIADGCALLDPFHWTVGLPRTEIAKCLVEMNDLAAMLAGLGPQRLLSFGAGSYFVAVGENKFGQSDLMRLRTHGRRDNL